MLTREIFKIHSQFTQSYTVRVDENFVPQMRCSCHRGIWKNKPKCRQSSPKAHAPHVFLFLLVFTLAPAASSGTFFVVEKFISATRPKRVTPAPFFIFKGAWISPLSWWSLGGAKQTVHLFFKLFFKASKPWKKDFLELAAAAATENNALLEKIGL